MATLKLQPEMRRNGTKYLDFVVDGKSLYEWVGYKFDTVSCLAQWPVTEETHKALRRLSLREPTDFPDNRQSLYVCGECGGLGCGAVSIIVDEQPETITWHSFGYERDWEDPESDEDNVEKLEGIGPFMFDKAQYFAVLETAMQLLGSPGADFVLRPFAP